ncbi:MAG: hypothetical protein EBR09_15270 [Proteobacteria bacterium]|nr:hypothetical protein [Pseudomonadota bacterium]
MGGRAAKKNVGRACAAAGASMADSDLPTLLKRHLKGVNIEGQLVQEKLQERRLVQVVSYLELVSMKLRHKKIHRDAFRQRMLDELEMAQHADMLERVVAMNG